jgi:hypothetical protein
MLHTPTVGYIIVVVKSVEFEISVYFASIAVTSKGSEVLPSRKPLLSC